MGFSAVAIADRVGLDEVLDAYHAAVHPQPKQARQTTPKQDKQTSKRKSPEMTL